MKVGFQVGNVVTYPSDAQEQWQGHLEQFRFARDVGFEFVSWGQHWLVHPFQHFQPMTALARLSAEAGEMELVTGVLLLPMINPVQLAEEVATLDHICQGRFVFGVGLGYRPEEFEATGVKMSQRASRFEEAMELMVRLWTEEEVTHHGRYYQVTGARPTARPYQQPHPRVWVAAMNDAPIKRAGRMGHTFFALGLETMESLKGHAELWRSTLEEYGHEDPGVLPIMRECFVAPTSQEARERARRGVEVKYGGYAQHGLPSAGEALAGGIDALLDEPFVVGSPEECLEKLAQLSEVRVTHVDLRLQWPEMTQAEVLGMMELVGKQIIPALREL